METHKNRCSHVSNSIPVQVARKDLKKQIKHWGRFFLLLFAEKILFNNHELGITKKPKCRIFHQGFFEV
jgi:hypothetical protein